MTSSSSTPQGPKPIGETGMALISSNDSAHSKAAGEIYPEGFARAFITDFFDEKAPREHVAFENSQLASPNGQRTGAGRELFIDRSWQKPAANASAFHTPSSRENGFAQTIHGRLILGSLNSPPEITASNSEKKGSHFYKFSGNSCHQFCTY